MKQALLIFALLLPLLVAKKISIAESGHWQQLYFQKLKSKFKYVNLSRFTNEQLGYQHEVTLPKVDSVTYRKLFKQSRIFTSYGDQPALYYAFSQKPQYYQLVFAGQGHHVPDLVLLHYAPDGKLIHEQVIASSFFDAGQGSVTHSVIRKDSLLIRSELNLDERPEGQPCDSTVTTFRIAQAGGITQLAQKKHKMKCR